MTDSSPLQRRILRFGLKTLLFLMVLVAVPLAWKFNRLRAQRRVVQAVIQSGGTAYYDYQEPEKVPFMGHDAVPPGPAWLRALLGNDMFAEVAYLSWSGREIPDDETVALIAELPSLRVLTIGNATDERLEQLSRSLSLAHVSVEGDFTDEGVAKLAQMANLETLDLTSPHLTAQSLVPLRACKRLEYVSVLSGQSIPAEAVEALRREIPGCDVRVARIKKRRGW